MIKKLFFIIALIFNILYAQTLNIAVASNVSYAMPKLKKEFNNLYPNITIHESLSSSGNLTAQIRNGAPYVLFMSANMKYPQALYKEGLALTKPLVYAKGALVYLSNKHLDYSKDIEILKNDKIKKIAIANPKTAPYGKAAFEAMENTGILKDIKHKLVYAQSISQTVSYALKASDIGLVAKSTLFSEKMKKYKKSKNWEDVNPKLYTPIDQGIVLLKNAQNNSQARAFYDFIISEKAKNIFKSYGYIIP